MRSLYQHETLSHKYVESTGNELRDYYYELLTINQSDLTPRQQEVISNILKRLAFEISMRMEEDEQNIAKLAVSLSTSDSYPEDWNALLEQE